jgi:hypothetical protein
LWRLATGYGKRSDPMTREDFTAALEQALQLRAVGFSRAELLDFVASVWPLAEENPDVDFWAREFIKAGYGSMTA